MNRTLNPRVRLTPRIPRQKSGFARTACILTAALTLAPCLHALSDEPQPAAQAVAGQPEPDLYSMKFDGRDVESLDQQLKSAFPSDNVVVAPSARHVRIDAFEVRNVRLKELGRTIEFLSEGRLTVEVIEREKGTIGNIWRIGSRNAANTAAIPSMKMRAVSAPNLFRHEQIVDLIITEAMQLEQFRLRQIEQAAVVRGGELSNIVKTKIEPLTTQKVFVLVGNEEGITGVESYIRAAEQLAVEKAAKKQALAASLAPTMRAVVAPHLFADEERLERFVKECDNVEELWTESHDRLMKMADIDESRGGVCIQRRRDEKLFVLIGSERDIAGMESLIQAAEKNAADLDAKQSAAKAMIVELEQQLRITEEGLQLEKQMMRERRDRLSALRQEIAKEFEAQSRDGKELGAEQRAEMKSVRDAQIKNLEQALAEGEARGRAQIEQLMRAALEIQAKLNAAQANTRGRNE